MKKILNDPIAYVDESLDGMCLAYPDLYKRPAEKARVIQAAFPVDPRKVAIVTGGGFGHLPVFAGYVGQGLADACAVGDVFSSPSVEQIVEAIHSVHRGSGVLLLHGNYSGDNMNFEMAAEIAEMKGIKVMSVRIADDVASAARHESAKRRGVAGLVYAYKIAGAKASKLAPLEEVAQAAQKAQEATRSIGVALTPCTVPAVGHPNFDVPDGQMEIGMGIHGERGVRRGPLLRADPLADEMLSLLLLEMPLERRNRVSILVNSLGATPLEELFIIFRRAASTLSGLGVEIVRPLVGRYATSMEMTGISLSICKLDEELEDLLNAPCNSPFLRI